MLHGASDPEAHWHGNGTKKKTIGKCKAHITYVPYRPLSAVPTIFLHVDAVRVPDLGRRLYLQLQRPPSPMSSPGSYFHDTYLRLSQGPSRHPVYEIRYLIICVYTSTGTKGHPTPEAISIC